jgi:YfiH family protein
MFEQHYFGLPILHFDTLERFRELACGVSTRAGARVGETFDLAPVRGPNRGANSTRWRRLALSLGLFDGLAPQLQVHGPDIVRVDAPDADFAKTSPADASFTARAGLGLLAFSADCPLVAVYAPGRAVGVAHASWRCTTTLIVKRLIERMADEVGCRPARMWAAVSPSAGPCCYEVGPEVYEAAGCLPQRDACFKHPTNSGDRPHFDLWEAAVQQMVAAGVPASHIELAEMCTICSDRFFSYRREGQGVGAFGLMIGRRRGY